MNDRHSNDRCTTRRSALAGDPDLPRQMAEEVPNAVFEGEQYELLGVPRGDRSSTRRGYCSG